MDLKSKIREVPDFPKKGVNFKDITPLLKDPVFLKESIEIMKKSCIGKQIDLVAGIESRGFIFGSLLASELDVGFIPIRKKGKLPCKTVSEEYELEYGSAVLEIHEDAVKEKQRVLIVDDLLATGGTARASANLIEKLGGVVEGFCFLIELFQLKGRKKILNHDVYSVILY